MPKGGITKLTPENRVKLEQAAAIDASVEEMAYYCDVSRQTIYNWLENDKDLFDKIERLRAKPVLTARQTIAKGVAESYSNAMDYLARKRKSEFSTRQELTGKDGESLPQPLLFAIKEDVSNNQCNEENSEAETED